MVRHFTYLVVTVCKRPDELRPGIRIVYGKIGKSLGHCIRVPGLGEEGSGPNLVRLRITLHLEICDYSEIVQTALKGEEELRVGTICDLLDGRVFGGYHSIRNNVITT